MTLEINDRITINSLQELFTKEFPYLKIEFFNKPHSTGSGTEKKFIRDGRIFVGESRNQHNDGKLEFDGEMTVAQVEKKFASEFGLNVQVFRKSGKLWLETTVTDGWSLNYQNEQGKELSEGGIMDQPENPDIHEQE